MKNVLFALLQFILFLIVFAVGSFMPPFHVESVLAVVRDGTRVFVWDGAILMILLCAIILIIEALRKRIAAAGPWTVFALVIAALVGYASKFGFLTR